jgi:hypothetical protein
MGASIPRVGQVVEVTRKIIIIKYQDDGVN